MDGRGRRVGGRSGQPTSEHGWTVLKGGVMKEKEGPCHLLCTWREAPLTFSKRRRRDGDEEERRKLQRKKDKRTQEEVKRKDFQSVVFLHFIHQFNKNPFEAEQCAADCKHTVSVCVCQVVVCA